MFMPFSLHTVGHNNVFFLFFFLKSLFFFKKFIRQTLIDLRLDSQEFLTIFF